MPNLKFTSLADSAHLVHLISKLDIAFRRKNTSNSRGKWDKNQSKSESMIQKYVKIHNWNIWESLRMYVCEILGIQIKSYNCFILAFRNWMITKLKCPYMMPKNGWNQILFHLIGSRKQMQDLTFTVRVIKIFTPKLRHQGAIYWLRKELFWP